MAEASRNNTGVSSSASVSSFESFVGKHFVRLLVGIASGGGALAFLVPWLLYIAGITGEADTNLRLHILYVTGGTIAVLGLVETRHKNTTDRSKALSEQACQFNETIAKEREKIEADKAKTSKTIYGRYMLSGAAGTSQQSSSFPTGKTPQPASVVFMRLLA